jgi:hypothetical protein
VDLIALLNKQGCGFFIISAGQIGHVAFRIDWPFPGQYSIGVDGVNRPICRKNSTIILKRVGKLDEEKRENALGVGRLT